MTFAETHKVIQAINEIESWSKGLARIWASENPSHDKAAKYEIYLAEAKQTVFDLCAK